MSRPVFRTRNLDPSKRIRVIIDQHDNNNNDLQHLQTPASSIQRCVPQMPFVSGMEREEEAEYHLQNALDAQQRLGSAKIRAVPTPDLYEDPNSASIYPPIVQLPKQLIRIQPLQFESDYPEYDMDTNDTEWFEKWNNCLGLTHLQYEEIIDKLENSSGRTVLSYEDAKTLIKEDEDLLKNVYEFWLERRNTTVHKFLLKNKNTIFTIRFFILIYQGKRLKPRLLTERDIKEEKGKHHPYVAFRRRIEKMTTRKNRKNDEQAYMSMLKLRSSFQAIVKLTNMIKVRESIKQQLLECSLQIFQTRCESSESDDYMLNNGHIDIIKSLTKSNLNSIFNNNNNNNVLTISSLNKNSSTLATLLSTPPPSTNSLLYQTQTSSNEINNDDALEPKVKRMKVSQSSLMSASATMKHLISSATMQQQQQQNSSNLSKPSSASSYSKRVYARMNINNSGKLVSLPPIPAQNSVTANSLLLERLSPSANTATAAVVISSKQQTAKRRQKQQQCQNTFGTANNLLNKKNRTHLQSPFLLTPFSNDNNITQTDNTAGGYLSSLKPSSLSSILLAATYNARPNEDIGQSNIYSNDSSPKTPTMTKNEITSLFDSAIRRTLFSDHNGRFQNLANLPALTNALTPTVSNENNNSVDTSNPWQFRPKAGCRYLKSLSTEQLYTRLKYRTTNDKKSSYYNICCSTQGQIGRSRVRIGRGGRLLYDRRLPKESSKSIPETKQHFAEKPILWRMSAKPDLANDYKLHSHLTVNDHDLDLSRKHLTNKSRTIIRVVNDTLTSLYSETNDSTYSVIDPSISTTEIFYPSLSSNESLLDEERKKSFIELDHPYSCTSKRVIQALKTLSSTSASSSTHFSSTTTLSPLALSIDTPPTPPPTDHESDRSKSFILPPVTPNTYSYPTTPPTLNRSNDTPTDSSNTNITNSKLSTLLAFGSNPSLSSHSGFKVQPNLTSSACSISQADSSLSHTISPSITTSSHFLLRVPAPGLINNQYNNPTTNTSSSKSSLFNSTANHRNVVIPSAVNETKNVLLPTPFTLFQHKTTNGYNGSITSFVAPSVKLSPIDSSSMITEVT
ncbi:unnamed protein product [Didymodactylos carnosus]|uniref:Enhancer of polycomb-like protein n=1 Tax=Didymodactylos carnosus TaxID=1234261 RepID=A0A813NV23_9BILA|nr:unnamed protein product [Didymodactylos carnosus]CAF0804673.1 unnamed protein product [Didymodactylos carnosus]CAF3522775.1 unnamed protein product [Didymodactylos carnosus]CAF3588254.1 unnamed protein product [Didymodactylos carnosus]